MRSPRNAAVASRMSKFAAAAALLYGAGCMDTPPQGASAQPVGRYAFVNSRSEDTIILDFARMQVERNGRSEPLEDCSNSELYCLASGDWLRFAFPITCPTFSERRAGWDAEDFHISYEAPSRHRPTGSGRYYARSTGAAPFLYDMQFGWVGLTFSALPPENPAYDGPEAVYSRGSVTNPDLAPLFPCTPPA